MISQIWGWICIHPLATGALLLLAAFVAFTVLVWVDFRKFTYIQAPWEERNPGRPYPGDKQALAEMRRLLAGDR